MHHSTYTLGRSASWWIGALAWLLLPPSALRAQGDLPGLRAWHLLPSVINPAHTEVSPSATLLYGSAGKDSQHYLIHGSLPLSTEVTELAIGGTIEQAKSVLWSASDLTGRGSIALLRRANWRLTGGIELNLFRRSFDGERALREGITDSQLPTTRREGKTFDFGLGVFFAGERLQAGLSAQHLLASEIVLSERFTTSIPRWLHSYLAYRLGSRTGWSLSPRARFSLRSPDRYLWELALGLSYQERYQLHTFTGKQRWGLSGAVQLGRFLLGYTWEQGQQTYHELLLSYRLPRPTATPRTSRYTSIRLL